MRKTIIPIFLDRFKSKNQLQQDFLLENGLEPHWFVTDPESPGTVRTHNLSAGFVARLMQVFRFFRTHRRHIHHIEIYPGGRFSFIYALLAKVTGLRILCCERGDIQYFTAGTYDRLTRFSMWLVYRLADIVWYREPYMLAQLQRIGARKVFFVHNCIEPVSAVADHSVRDIDFLWVNRLIPERRFDWVKRILARTEFAQTRNYLLGARLEKALFRDHESEALEHLPPNIHALGYTDPLPYYRRARFFLLPATIIFANHALLEAMAHGVIPIITQSTQGDAGLIVEHGVSGLLSGYSETEFEQAMQQALHMSPEAEQQMAANARLKMSNDFSPQRYKQALAELYDRLQQG